MHLILVILNISLCNLFFLQVAAIKELLKKQKEEEERLQREEEERIRKEEEAIRLREEQVCVYDMSIKAENLFWVY